MKKLLIVVAAVLLSVALIGCQESMPDDCPHQGMEDCPMEEHN